MGDSQFPWGKVIIVGVLASIVLYIFLNPTTIADIIQGIANLFAQAFSGIFEVITGEQACQTANPNNPGAFRDPNGNCYVCPSHDNKRLNRTTAEVTAANACEIVDSKPAKKSNKKF